MKNRKPSYEDLTNRNIGLLTEAQQQKIRNTKVAVSGLGGIGSPIAEMLCRLGVERFSLLDHGKFEPTNLNRQIHCFTDTENLYKTDVTADFLSRINDDVRCDLFREITEENVDLFLKDVGVVVLGIDSVKPCLIISRAARRMKIPLVEGWAVVAANVRVFNENTPSLEEVYEMPTINRKIASITKEEEKQLLIHSLVMVQKQIKGLSDLYPPTAMQRMEEKNEGTTLGPLVWLTCSLMATEVMKLILDWGTPALAPEFANYNPITHTILR